MSEAKGIHVRKSRPVITASRWAPTELPAAVCALILGGQRTTRTGPLHPVFFQVHRGDPRSVCRKASRNPAGDLYFRTLPKRASRYCRELRMRIKHAD